MTSLLQSTFIHKLGAAVLVVALGDWLFYQHNNLGLGIGLFALGWVTAALMTLPALRKNKAALIAALAALGYAGMLIYDPSLLGAALFWCALGVAALLPRMAQFEDAWRWALRLALHNITLVVGPWGDLFRVKRTGRKRHRVTHWRRVLPLLPLPLIGCAVFVALFAAANPIIGDVLAKIQLPAIDFMLVFRILLWGFLFTLVWSTLRPFKLRLAKPHAPSATVGKIPGVTIGSVTLALITFNALFALQNGLDLAYLWSGAHLPKGMTLAGYAHRGAYPLIATALLAGLFVLVTLHPKAETAQVPLIRRLVVAWVVQNIFLVASSILRSLDYIDAYSLTVLRIAALAWMVLVAVGLALICWRMLRGKSEAWLINANALAGVLMLSVFTVVDAGEVAAQWNVTHAREVGGHGAALDLCYLGGLGSSALVPLTELETRLPRNSPLLERVAYVRTLIADRYEEDRAEAGESWREAQRAAKVDLLTKGYKHVILSETQDGRNCDGSINPPPPPLTPEQGK